MPSGCVILGTSSADLSQIAAMPHVEPQSVRLKEARSLAQQGKYADAMKVYRDLYPNGPPAGDMALEFYETQAAIPELRRQAIDRLHELADAIFSRSAICHRSRTHSDLRSKNPRRRHRHAQPLRQLPRSAGRH